MLKWNDASSEQMVARVTELVSKALSSRGIFYLLMLIAFALLSGADSKWT